MRSTMDSHYRATSTGEHTPMESKVLLEAVRRLVIENERIKK